MDIGVISVRYARALLKSSVEAKLEDINMTNHDDYTNVHDRTNTNNHKDDDNDNRDDNR